MTPSIAFRIDSLIQAMNDMVLPAIESDKSLAREQAQLVVAHMALIRSQLSRADAFDQLEQSYAIDLCKQLDEIAAGDPALSEARRALQSGLSEAQRETERQTAIRTINGAAETFMREARANGARTSIDAATSAILAHTKDQSRRNRIWFASNGFDAEKDSLPNVESLFSARA